MKIKTLIAALIVCTAFIASSCTKTERISYGIGFYGNGDQATCDQMLAECTDALAPLNGQMDISDSEVISKITPVAQKYNNGKLTGTLTLYKNENGSGNEPIYTWQLTAFQE